MPTLIALALAISLAFATQAAAVQWSLGVKGGVNFADFSGDINLDETSTRTGFMGGVFAQAELTNEVALRLEALSVAKGTDFTQFILSTPVEGTFEIDYVEFPLLFVLRVPPGPKTASFNVFLGPTFGFNTSSNVDAGTLSFDIDDAVDTFDFGMTFGVGFEYSLTSLSILFDARYSFGITNVVEDLTDGNSIEVSNRGIGVMAGVAFPLR